MERIWYSRPRHRREHSRWANRNSFSFSISPSTYSIAVRANLYELEAHKNHASCVSKWFWCVRYARCVIYYFNKRASYSSFFSSKAIYNALKKSYRSLLSTVWLAVIVVPEFHGGRTNTWTIEEVYIIIKSRESSADGKLEDQQHWSPLKNTAESRTTAPKVAPQSIKLRNKFLFILQRADINIFSLKNHLSLWSRTNISLSLSLQRGTLRRTAPCEEWMNKNLNTCECEYIPELLFSFSVRLRGARSFEELSARRLLLV